MTAVFHAAERQRSKRESFIPLRLGSLINKNHLRSGGPAARNTGAVYDTTSQQNGKRETFAMLLLGSVANVSCL